MAHVSHKVQIPFLDLQKNLDFGPESTARGHCFECFGSPFMIKELRLKDYIRYGFGDLHPK